MIEVKSCKECRGCHIHFPSKNCFCSEMDDQRIDDVNIIPNWCPLSDLPKGTKKTGHTFRLQ